MKYTGKVELDTPPLVPNEADPVRGGVDGDLLGGDACSFLQVQTENSAEQPLHER